LHLITHTHTNTRQDSSGGGIGPTQRPLPDNTQHSTRQTFVPQKGIEAAIPASGRSQTHALDLAVTIKWFKIYRNTR